MKKPELTLDYVSDLLHHARVMKNYCSGRVPHNMMAIGVELGSIFTKLDQLLEKVEVDEEINKCSFGKFKEEDEEEDDDDENEVDIFQEAIDLTARNVELIKEMDKLKKELEKYEEDGCIEKTRKAIFDLQDLIIRLIKFKKIDQIEIPSILNTLRNTGVQECDIKVMCHLDNNLGPCLVDDELPY
jgi:hypothetical protein